MNIYIYVHIYACMSICTFLFKCFYCSRLLRVFFPLSSTCYFISCGFFRLLWYILYNIKPKNEFFWLKFSVSCSPHCLSRYFCPTDSCIPQLFCQLFIYIAFPGHVSYIVLIAMLLSSNFTQFPTRISDLFFFILIHSCINHVCMTTI